MRRVRLLFLCGAGVLCFAHGLAEAGPGDVVIPAHRSRDGTLIPANVPPSSGGTVIPVVSSGRLAPSRVGRPVSRGRAAPAVVPLFIDARPIRR